jgi:hypothetical protein
MLLWVVAYTVVRPKASNYGVPAEYGKGQTQHEQAYG